MAAEFEISLNKSYFKFNCSHFIAYRGYRERLHGHNYHISVKLTGTDELSRDGYLLDFGRVKNIVRAICEDMDEYFLVPIKSDVLKINVDEKQLLLECEDGAVFSFPKSDCKLLPLVHTSAEELARYLWCRVVRDFGIEPLRFAGIQRIELSLCETEGQAATFRCDLPDVLLALDGSPARSDAAHALPAAASGVPTLRGNTSGLEELLHSMNDYGDVSALGSDKGGGLVLPELTNGDDDLAYMPEPPMVVISK
jgi:6-pyruvoyltetrahydropterin/6-carboxytetrahydropterin synthase